MPQAHLNSNSDDLNIRLDHKHFTSPLNQASITLEPNAVAALKSIRGGSCEGREFTGWFDWPNRRGFKIAEEIMSWKATYREDFDLVVVIGIGGSYLGTKALADISAHTFAPGFIKDHQTSTPQLVFAGQNMSESALGDLLDLMETRSPILNIISKSGTTTEPGVAFRVLRSWLENRYGKAIAATRIIATTDLKNGALRRLADSNHYRTFEVPDDVGGRYSVLTAVGLVPLALCGFNILEMLEGAHRVFQDFKSDALTGSARVGIEYAICRVAAWNAGKVIEVMTYPEPRMRNFVEWYKQLFGESDGKDFKGLFPASIECTMDLHSMGQYMQDGARTMMETFIAVDNPRGNRQRITVPALEQDTDELKYLEGTGLDNINDSAMLATRLAHFAGGVPCLELRIPDLSPRTMGALFAIFETSCAIGGLMLGINPFNQPGVEAYKINLFALLGKPGFSHLKQSLVGN